MKELPVIKVTMLLFMCSITMLHAQQQSIKEQTSTNMIATQTKDDEKILSELNARFIKNFLTQDTLSHNKIIHKDFVCIEASGEIVNRDVYMKNWATDFDNSGYKTFSYTDEVIRIFGNMALVRAKTVYTILVNGEMIEGKTIYTDTYVKENDKWKCIQAHITPVKK